MSRESSLSRSPDIHVRRVGTTKCQKQRAGVMSIGAPGVCWVRICTETLRNHQSVQSTRTQLEGRTSDETQEGIKAGLVRTQLEGTVSEETHEIITTGLQRRKEEHVPIKEDGEKKAPAWGTQSMLYLNSPDMPTSLKQTQQSHRANIDQTEEGIPKWGQEVLKVVSNLPDHDLECGASSPPVCGQEVEVSEEPALEQLGCEEASDLMSALMHSMKCGDIGSDLVRSVCSEISQEGYCDQELDRLIPELLAQVEDAKLVYEQELSALQQKQSARNCNRTDHRVSVAAELLRVGAEMLIPRGTEKQVQISHEKLKTAQEVGQCDTLSQTMLPGSLENRSQDSNSQTQIRLAKSWWTSMIFKTGIQQKLLGLRHVHGQLQACNTWNHSSSEDVTLKLSQIDAELEMLEKENVLLASQLGESLDHAVICGSSVPLQSTTVPCGTSADFDIFPNDRAAKTVDVVVSSTSNMSDQVFEDNLNCESQVPDSFETTISSSHFRESANEVQEMLLQHRQHLTNMLSNYEYTLV